MSSMEDDQRLTDEDRITISKVARQFRVSDTMAYHRALSLRLLSYQVQEDADKHYATLRLIMAHAIADGFTEGNELYPQANETMQMRYGFAADAVLKEFAALQAASPPQQKGK